MTEHAGHIRNPLTVISRFAAIAEISGTAVLPFIAPENQATYIWFLMLFPTFLVGTFFLTLNYNHKTLYAPSDYQNQNHFLNLFGIVTPSEREEKLNEELVEATLPVHSEPTDGEIVGSEESQKPDEPAPAGPSPKADEEQKPSLALETNKTEPNYVEVKLDTTARSIEAEDDDNPINFDLKEFSNKTKHESKLRLKEIERRSIQKLKLATKIEFSESVKFDIPYLKHPLIFDAVADQDEIIHIAEVKYFGKMPFSAERFYATLMNADIAAKNIYNVSNRKVILHLIVVLDQTTSTVTTQNIQIALKNAAKKYSYSTKVYVISEDRLPNKGIPSSWLFGHVKP